MVDSIHLTALSYEKGSGPWSALGCLYNAGKITSPLMASIYMKMVKFDWICKVFPALTIYESHLERSTAQGDCDSVENTLLCV